MGELISLAERRAARAEAHAPPARPRVGFFFDLASPWTYLAAERVDRRFADVRWQPAIGEALPGARELASQRRAAEQRADELQLPLVWPEAQPAAGRSAMRVAALAAEHGRSAEFVLAASRLAYCGGYDIDDPEILAEAAAAADLGLDECLRAAGELRRDGPMEQAALRLLAQGADELPVLVVGRSLFCGEHRVPEAAAAFSGRRAAPPPARRTYGG
jgi:2-hydroxychromene-2-carboxylate isomerase